MEKVISIKYWEDIQMDKQRVAKLLKIAKEIVAARKVEKTYSKFGTPGEFSVSLVLSMKSRRMPLFVIDDYTNTVKKEADADKKEMTKNGKIKGDTGADVVVDHGKLAIYHHRIVELQMSEPEAKSFLESLGYKPE